jgi:SAM-dependent methyltransferase
MCDFLEHLPDEAAAGRVLKTFARAARHFLFIRHPSFDDVEYLRDLGLKLGWTDWSSHTNMMRTKDFRRLFAELGWGDYVIVPHGEILDSLHPAIVPLSAPINTEEHDDALFGRKPRIEFDPPVYAKFDIFVRLNPGLDDETWSRTTNVDGWRMIWESPAETKRRRQAKSTAEPGGRSGRLAQLFDPWLTRRPGALPKVPESLEAYLDNHVLECVRQKRYYFLRLAHLMDAVGRIPEPITDVLSFGAGMGHEEAFLAGRFPSTRVVATDRVLTTPDSPIPNLRFEPLDLLAPPGPERFDLVLSIECLEHIEDYRRAFRHQAARVRPGKYLYISVPFASREQQRDADLQRTARELCEHVTPGLTVEDLEELFAENGLEVLHASNMFHLDIVLPVRHIVEAMDAAELHAGAEAIANVLLLDLQDRRVSSSRESEGLRFLGRRVQ